MPKKVKTRKQKMLADLRRSTAPALEKKVDIATYSIPTQRPAAVSVSRPTPSAVFTRSVKTHALNVDYHYLTADLRKTILLTCMIVIAELVIRFTVKGI